MTDTYRVVTAHASVETKVKGSRFVAEALPVLDEAEAEVEIAAIRRRAYRATHHCTAYRVGIEGTLSRYHDAGEPSGTAGAPILRQIDARGLTNTLVVVTRYFGGTKLGTGGLLRAYGEAAAAVLDASPQQERVIRVPFCLRFAYGDTSPAMQALSQFDVEIRDSRYTDETELVIYVRRSQASAFRCAFTEALSGRGAVEPLGGAPA